YMLTTGLRIRKLREIRGYCQSYMAQRLGISQEQYSYLETKQKLIPAEQVRNIAVLLDVQEDYLRTFDPHQLITEDHTNDRRSVLHLIARFKEELALLEQRFG
ncbi:MAG TPA: helix-turn-helix transcriptional regulator, partial [Ferruginibacter sp.]|nr:helix-turn-helix transcriptional regulator [Ferruginibacter sp.]